MRPVLPAPLPPCPSAPSSAGPGRTTSNAAVSAVFRAAPYSGQDPAGPGRRGSCGLRAAGGGESGEAAAALGGPAARGKSLTALSLCRGSEDEEHRQPELDSSNVHDAGCSYPFPTGKPIPGTPAHATLPGEYESLLSLEGLLATASQCLHKLQLLRAAVESQAKLCPGCSGDMGSCSPACAPARGQMCGPADVLPVPLLCYYSSQELKDLFALKLQVSVLHQEVALQKVLMVEVLPALESRLCLEASLAQLYRAIYSHLCQGGRRFLVLVRDELAE
ncbi:tubulin epsilon and delta complex protein 2 isoform X3 [Pogoniulus pusillus]|uniref:tubulin epsilon and delta complex protein 2 isoform X3 n=1 Tax=Pogoniulus pusillus TaxID=488313 RepID=UPI0030B97AA6